MTAAGALAKLRLLGVTARIDGEALRLRPASAVLPELLAELRQHKAEVLALLVANEPPPILSAASREQTGIVGQDHNEIAGSCPLTATVPLDAGTLAAWEVELTHLLGNNPAHRIEVPDLAHAYFAAEARRRLAQVTHNREAAGLLMTFWRHARATSCPATTPLIIPLSRRR